MPNETESTEQDAASVQERQDSMVTSVQVHELSSSKVELHVEVGSDHVDRAFKNVYRQLSRSGRIPGFRVGRVPPSVLRRYFSEESIKDAAVAELAPDAVTEAIEQAGIVVVDASPIRNVQIDEGDVLRFSATLEVRPKPRLGQYKGLSLTRPRIEVTDEQVEQEMQEMRDSVSAWIDTDRKQVRKGDRVYADVTVNVEGEEPMSDTDVGFHVGQGRTQPPIDEGMIDAQIGSTIDIETQYPDDFDDEDLAGKPATATVTIKRLEEHREPELNDEFAKENYGFDTLEELRADIRQRLEEAATEEAENELKQQALTKVVEGSVIEIPKRMARDGAEQRIEQLATDAGQYGMRYEDLLRAEKASHEQITARFQRASEQALERHFVIEAIAEGEGIEVSDDEVEAELTRMAEQANRPVAAVREELEAEGDIEPVRLRLREQKVLALLVESATVTEAPASEDEPGAESEETDEETPPAEADAGAEDRGDGHDADRGDATQ